MENEGFPIFHYFPVMFGIDCVNMFLPPRQVQKLRAETASLRSLKNTVTLLNRHVLPHLVLKCAEWCTKRTKSGARKRNDVFNSKDPQYPKERNSFFVLSIMYCGAAHMFTNNFTSRMIHGIWFGSRILMVPTISPLLRLHFHTCHVFVDALAGGKTIGNKAVIGGSWFAITIIDMEHIPIIYYDGPGDRIWKNN